MIVDSERSYLLYRDKVNMKKMWGPRKDKRKLWIKREAESRKERRKWNKVTTRLGKVRLLNLNFFLTKLQLSGHTHF